MSPDHFLPVPSLPALHRFFVNLIIFPCSLLFSFSNEAYTGWELLLISFLCQYACMGRSFLTVHHFFFQKISYNKSITSQCIRQARLGPPAEAWDTRLGSKKFAAEICRYGDGCMGRVEWDPLWWYKIYYYETWWVSTDTDRLSWAGRSYRAARFVSGST